MRYRIDLTISQAARSSLAASGQDSGSTTVPSIVWVTDRESGVSDWMVGFYDRSKIPDEFFVDADGVQIVVELQWRKALAGKELDLIRGRFVLRARE